MKSEQLFEQAKEIIPGGVNSPVRAFLNVHQTPIFVDHACGSKVYDDEGNQYLDYIGSWGPMILGHASEVLTKDIEKEFCKGTSYGLPTKKEITLAKMMCDAYPGLDMVRMVNSGTEATMSAIRLARGYTNKDKIIKFEGNYHGHSDCLLVKAGSGALTFNTPTSPGVPQDFVKNTIVCRYNDIESVKKAIEENKDEIACVILEPIACNMGLVVGKEDFLFQLRELCTNENIVLIFDEVISGFRIAYGGAASYFGITPDMACFGKIIGGGLPVGAYGGKKEIMSMIAPNGPVYQAGTLSGNPLAMEMGIRQLTYLNEHPEVYSQINEYAIQLKAAIDKEIEQHNYPCHIVQLGSLLTLYFTTQEISCYEDVTTCDLQAFEKYYSCMLKKNIILAPSQFEGIFISYAHTEEDLQYTIEAMKEALAETFQ